MKRFILFFSLAIISFQLYAQNVGVGSLNPVKGKFVVQGVAGSGATNAVFGDLQAGISLQQNWPTIGFNQYRDFIIPGTYGARMIAGYSSLLTLSQDNGNMLLEMHGYGLHGGSSVPTTNGYLVFTPTGRLAVGHGNPGATVDAIRGTGNDGTAVFRGTNYNSHFNYSTGENTFIRGGKPGAHIFLNDNSSLGHLYIGGGSNVVAINTTNVAGAGTLVIRQTGEAAGISLLNDLWGGYRWEINNEQYNETSQCLVLRYSGRATPQMGWFRPTDGGYSSNSDLRLKEQVQDMPPAIEKIMQLRPVTYRFKSKNNDAPQTMGLIAQEVRSVFPEMVDVRQLKDDKEAGGITDLHGMNYDVLSVVAIKAIQEQQQMITELKKEIELLKEALKEKGK